MTKTVTVIKEYNEEGKLIKETTITHIVEKEDKPCYPFEPHNPLKDWTMPKITW